ncbi:hypothetical protein TNCT_217241 [Trichonephila clavata]|uniref:Uncharacterized protein n=1 Tax=Trichonephila clavata TaxID=2740835 RepID=A0A8X6HGG1_TRICU|nr:hypothetical protein TNCT_217241 [Trichonephila clavata]
MINYSGPNWIFSALIELDVKMWVRMNEIVSIVYHIYITFTYQTEQTSINRRRVVDLFISIPVHCLGTRRRKETCPFPSTTKINCLGDIVSRV